MHNEIIRYFIDGEIGDTNLIQEKERLVHFIETQMRDDGCVPVLDLEPQFTLDYQPASETYKFKLSIYGEFVGSEQECKLAGVSAGTMTMRYTPKTKLSQS